jgi:hypothetical protein
MATDTGNLPVITTTERNTVKTCPQKWWWRFREGLVPNGEVADALWFGTGVHIALAEWYLNGYKRGPHPADTFEAWAGDEMREIRAQLTERDAEWYDEPKYMDAVELGIAMLENYVNTYGKDPGWQIIAIEQPFNVKVTSHGKAIAWFFSTFDGVMRSKDDGRIYLIEHKTASQIDLAYLELDDQAGGYWAVATAVLRGMKVLKPNEEIAGIVYNFLRKAKPDPRPRNADGAYLNLNGEVSKKQSSPPFVRHTVERNQGELRSQMQRLADEVTWMNAMRDGTMPVLKFTGRHCARFCDYFNMCKLHENGGDAWLELADSLYTRRSPYDRYQKSASE